ncbi:hypothetical protein ABL118_003968 [Vibrio alginolyticus]|nr:hypothetical protein [Vibrio alginolyticus]EJI1384560.1 hypothetical protein [Vibrio alginolyticus]ELP9500903.1 hypothetical protein [Vibrio alginolyticus]
MPHVLIKHYPSHISREEKEHIANQISNIISTGFACSNDVVSVSMLDVEQEHWNNEVYQPDIENRQDILVKEPNY